MTEMNQTVARLKEKFPESILDVGIFRGEVTVTVPADRIVEIARFLHTHPDLEYHLLTDLCGVDRFPQVPRFEVVYHLCSVKKIKKLRLRTRLGENESIGTVESVWKVANWYEREVFDLFGIRFENHSDLRRILLWEGFEGHPMRKDYPVEGPDFDKPFHPEV
jgi:NADH-quinone oxidoreductase subunit C